jgi:tetratricopeptide (TPR) repeat protein
MLGGDQLLWRTRLELEENNIRQAIDWAVENDIELAARLVVSLHFYWQISGQILDAMQQYERIMPFQENLSSEIRPWLFVVSAEMMHHLGRTQESLHLETKALPLFLEQEDEAGAIFIYLLWSTAARRISKDINISIQLAQAGLQQIYTPGTASYYGSLLLESLSDSLTRSGRYEEAETYIKQGYQMCLQSEDMMTATYFLAQMTMLKIMQGQLIEGHRYAKECLNASRQLNIVQAELIALDNLGRLDYEAGNLDQAEEFIADGIALARETNYRYYQAGMNIVMGEILMAKNANQEALPFLQEAFSFSEIWTIKLEFWKVSSTWRNGYGVKTKRTPAPIRWMAGATAHLMANGQIQPPSEIARRARIREEMEASISPEGVARAWAKGQRLSIEESMVEISLALVSNST